MEFFKSNDLNEVINFILELKNKKDWDKKYLYSIILGKPNKNYYPDAKEIEFPYIELTITDGKNDWHNSIRLVIDLEKHEIYYYDNYKSDIKYEQKLVIIEPWDNQLKFKKSQN